MRARAGGAPGRPLCAADAAHTLLRSIRLDRRENVVNTVFVVHTPTTHTPLEADRP